jgi:hypothetical protein
VLTFPARSKLEDIEDAGVTLADAGEAGERTTPPTTPKEAQQVVVVYSLELSMFALCLDQFRTEDVEAVAPVEAKEDGPYEDATDELVATKTFFSFFIILWLMFL